MTKYKNATVHEYSIEFRIYGEDLDTSEITKELGLQPGHLRQRGEAMGAKHLEHSVWGYNACEDNQEVKYWESLEEGLAFLLGKLSTVKDKIDQYKGRYNLVFWCGHFQSSFDGGPTLSAPLLKQLGDFGVEVFIDNYISVAQGERQAGRNVITGTEVGGMMSDGDP